tara:strand:- start:142 stop:699 length:558 start_codon:yes stop_codon:yes gene_type:complete
MTNTKTCPFCAEEVQQAAVKCKHCGEFFDTEKNQQVNNKSNSLKYVIRTILAITFLLVWYNYDSVKNIFVVNEKNEICKREFGSENKCLSRLDQYHSKLVKTYKKAADKSVEGYYCSNFNAKNLKPERVEYCLNLVKKNLESQIRTVELKNQSDSIRALAEYFSKVRRSEIEWNTKQRLLDNIFR